MHNMSNEKEQKKCSTYGFKDVEMTFRKGNGSNRTDIVTILQLEDI